MDKRTLFLMTKGLATYALPYAHAPRKKIDHSARYYYAIWMRHLVSLFANGLKTHPEIIVELGPGETIGTGIAALLTGAKKYTGLDVVQNTSRVKNLKMFEDLVKLLKKRTPIPDEQEFPLILPKLKSYQFPANILSDKTLAFLLEKNRIKQIRQAILSEKSDFKVDYQTDWQKEAIGENSVDLVFSQAVMEHVEKLGQTYTAIYSWLKPNGLTSHTVDFKSHHSASSWDGHWKYHPWQWKLIKGKRKFLINRFPHSEHLNLLKKAGFKIIKDEIYKTDATDQREIKINHKKSDLSISEAFIIAKK